jgi:hypothetical protein
MQAALKEGEEQIAKKIDVLVNAAKEDIKAIPGRGYEAFADLVNKEYAFTLEGIKKSVLDTIGKSPVELMDNFLGAKADEFVVDWVSSLFESEGITLSGDLAKNTSGTTTDTNTNNVVVNGAIHIVSTPPGADIWLDNSKESLQTPNTLHEITPGDHKVVLKIPGGYQDYARTVSVIAGQTAQISAKLEPLPAATGNLRIASDQSDATIVIDGTTQDVKTPASFGNVPVGSYKITVKKAGFQDYSERVDVEPLQERQVWAPLKPLQLAKGTLNIGSVPAGADIYIDGQKQGSQTPSNNIVEARTYKVGLKKAGYKDYSATATVAEGRITELWAKLEAAESTPVTSYDGVYSTGGGQDFVVSGNTIKGHFSRERSTASLQNPFQTGASTVDYQGTVDNQGNVSMNCKRTGEGRKPANLETGDKGGWITTVINSTYKGKITLQGNVLMLDCYDEKGDHIQATKKP